MCEDNKGASTLQLTHVHFESACCASMSTYIFSRGHYE